MCGSGRCKGDLYIGCACVGLTGAREMFIQDSNLDEHTAGTGPQSVNHLRVENPIRFKSRDRWRGWGGWWGAYRGHVIWRDED